MDISRFETLLVERRGAVDWVTLNRPHQLNAMNSQLVQELSDERSLPHADAEPHSFTSTHAAVSPLPALWKPPAQPHA